MEPGRGRRVGAIFGCDDVTGAAERTQRSGAGSDYDASTVRAWASSNNSEVSERGRISKVALEQYRAAGH